MRTHPRATGRCCGTAVRRPSGLAMRTDDLAVHYQAVLTLAGILLWTTS
ncbi:hypothetical protein FB565_008299 [Actinoplanes lutulentus]|uniref:Uncharacterized protein n=1 Tax=Actinoplanes lutulentus TaxID=1287878 RepID=A0A327ZAL3_9ACTN|nr:hypothetical protein [Actinoplanes lutulentus]MBB2948516.1 hypothetical protein [Actinoplanes lutulentus]RAK34452.1 hypothetical protein B0I29_11151 [Actinoplanes lutulentus]